MAIAELKHDEVIEDTAPPTNIFEGADESAQSAEPEAAEPEAVEPEADSQEAAEPTADTQQPIASGSVSPIMRELAINNGLPSSLVDFCYDDNQVQHLMDMNRNAKDAPTTTEETLTAKMMIPEEEFDSKDPLHAQQQHLVDVINKGFSQLKQETNESLTSSNNLMAEREQQLKNQLYGAYDKALDTLDQEIIGAKGSPERIKSWPLFAALLAANPDSEYDELAIQAARATHEKLITSTAVKAQQKNLDQQKTRTLGGGGTPPPVETPVKPMDEFRNFLRSMHSVN